MVERLVLEERHVELFGHQRLTDVMREARMPGDRRQVARAAAFVGDLVAVADAERERRVVIEEERRDVIVVDRSPARRAFAPRATRGSAQSALKIGPQTGSSGLCRSCANPIVGVCAVPIPPMIRATTALLLWKRAAGGPHIGRPTSDTFFSSRRLKFSQGRSTSKFSVALCSSSASSMQVISGLSISA